MTRKDFHKVVLGRAELLDLVDFGIVGIQAKVDTGAYHSSIHTDSITLSSDGKALTFQILGGHPATKVHTKTITTSDFKMVWVQNSFGQREERYQIRLRVKLGPKLFKAHFTLANRAEMSYPVLLGRELLNDRFMVDPSYTKVDRSELQKINASGVSAKQEVRS